MALSIAMCTYNGARYLATQLGSLAQQTLLPDELVVCDDGSTDTTLDILEDFKRCAAFRVRIFKNHINLGYTGNFEQAILLCQGDLIALCDQDDLWYPQKLAVLSAMFAQDPGIGGAFSDGDLLDKNLRPTGEAMWQSHRFTAREQRTFSAGTAATLLFRRNVVTGMTMIFRSSLRDTLLPIPRSWTHDAWLAFMLVASAKLVPCGERLVGYRTHDAQQIGPAIGTKQKLRRMARMGVSDFLKRSRANNLIEYEKAAIQFDDLAEHLRAVGTSKAKDLAIHASAKAMHARSAIATLSLARVRRAEMLVRHIRSYQRYSSPGMQNLLRDLVL